VPRSIPTIISLSLSKEPVLRLMENKAIYIIYV
jgi:hypothetical protein